MFFNGFTMLLMMLTAGITWYVSRRLLTVDDLITRLADYVGSEVDNDGQIVIYTDRYVTDCIDES
jgi:hypothetical protein